MLLFQIDTTKRPISDALKKLDQMINAQPSPEFISLVSNKDKFPQISQDVLFGAVFSKQNITGADVFVLGERHTTEWQRDFVAQRMENLKNLGFSVIAIESVKTSNQDMLDSKDLARISDTLHVSLGWDVPNSENSVIALIKEAQRCDLKVMGISPETGKEGFFPDEASLAAKDNHMASRIISEKGSGKILVLCGAAHNEGICKRLGEAGLNSISAVFVGGDPVQAGLAQSFYNVGSIISVEKASRIAGRAQELFIIPKSEDLPSSKECYYPDYIIHMPEIEGIPSFMKYSNPLNIDKK